MRGVILVFSLGAGPKEHPRGDSWFGPDKLQHFFVSAFVQSMSYGTLRAAGAGHSASLTGASLTSAAVGVGKEIYDRRAGGAFSLKDLTWDAAGAGTATVALVRTVR